MKKILLATTVLVGTAGFAAAEVSLSGDARMGVVSTDGNAAFSSRARVAFSGTGETDGGLAFGASFRADNAAASCSAADPLTVGEALDAYEAAQKAANKAAEAVFAAGGTDEEAFAAGNAAGDAVVVSNGTTCGGGAVNGAAGTVFISGAFGKLSMGDNDSAAQATVGQVAGVGYTGLGDHNEVTYLGDDSPSALYTYTAGALTVAASVGQVSGESQTSLAASYSMGDYTIAAGAEAHDDTADTHFIVGGTAKFGAVSVKAIYGQLGDDDQYALSATYTADALSVTAFHNMALLSDDTANGVGVSYSLGGGAAVSAGYTQADEAGDLFDAGVTFSF